MYTLGDETTGVIHKTESWSINHVFVASTALPKGALVKLNTSTGKVQAATAQDAFGQVAVGCKNADEEVTVQTQFQAIQDMEAGEDGITIGAKLRVAGLNAAGTHMVAEVADTDGDVIVAVALTAGDDGDVITVGVYRHFETLTIVTP